MFAISFAGETRIGQKIRAADRLGDGCQLVGRRDKKNEPGAILGSIDVHCRISRMLAIVRPEEFSIA
jgi:hypothetical protein